MANAQPNILFLIAHDLGRHLGCYGIPTVHSPYIDRLAAEGVRFANSFCVAPQCSPSRASIFTGRYPHNNGVLGLTHGLFQWDLHREEKHLAGLLREAGYATALAHIQHETLRPRDMGFDELLDKSTLNLPPNAQQADIASGLACNYLKTRQNQTQPFYLQVGFFEPHRAPGVGKEFGPMPPDREHGVTIPGHIVDDEGAQTEFAAYQGAIRKLDEAVGAILSTLEECGLRDNTLVVFTTDHGIPFPRAKCSVYDPGLQTCLIMRWPQSQWGSRKVLSSLVPHVDILPTLCEISGAAIPENVQGRSSTAALNGGKYQPREEIFGEMTYHDYYDPVRCIRTGRHKLIVAFCYNPGFMDPSQSWRPRTTTVHPARPHLSRHDLVELYDLQYDPLEHNNLANVEEYAGVRDGLLRRLHHWMRDTNDPLLQGVPPSPMHLQAVDILQGAWAIEP